MKFQMWLLDCFETSVTTRFCIHNFKTDRFLALRCPDAECRGYGARRYVGLKICGACVLCKRTMV